MNRHEFRELRVSAGMTQSDVAACIGVTYYSIGNFEAGRNRSPQWSTARAAEFMRDAIGDAKDADREKIAAARAPVDETGLAFFKSAFGGVVVGNEWVPRPVGPEAEDALARVMWKFTRSEAQRARMVDRNGGAGATAYCVICSSQIRNQNTGRFCKPECRATHEAKVQKFLQTRTDLEISQAQIRRRFKIAETSIQGYEKGSVFKPKWDPDAVMRWMNAKADGVNEGRLTDGQRFAKLRRSKKQTQVQVAERFGVSKTAITDFERGEIRWPQWDVAAVREWLETL